MDRHDKNHDTLPTDAAGWFATLAEGRADAATRVAFTDWLRESPKHIRELLEIILLRADVEKSGVSAETLQAWIDEASRPSVQTLRAPIGDAASLLRKRSLFSRRYLLAAAAGILCIVAGATWWVQADRYGTRLGEQRLISLRDGSMVSLNTDSQVRVELTERARTIELAHGEAYFDVKKDPLRPFSVRVGEVVVTAIGTAFNVRATPSGAVVSVAEGKVEVRTRTSSKAPPVALTAGERAVVSANAPTARLPDVKAGHAALWMQGRIEFESATLEEVMLEFARYRRLEVGFADDTLRQRRITGSFNARDPEAALAYIETLPGIRVERIRDEQFFVDHDEE